MKSVSILSYESSPEKRLTEVARHYQTSWATAVAHINEATYLESDAEGNLTLLKRNVTGVTEDDRRRLEVVSTFRLGQMVNRIRAFDSQVSQTAVVVPTAFLGTVRLPSLVY
jgi:DNA damage-binding protein 1